MRHKIQGLIYDVDFQKNFPDHEKVCLLLYLCGAVFADAPFLELYVIQSIAGYMTFFAYCCERSFLRPFTKSASKICIGIDPEKSFTKIRKCLKSKPTTLKLSWSEFMYDIVVFLSLFWEHIGVSNQYTAHAFPFSDINICTDASGEANQGAGGYGCGIFMSFRWCEIPFSLLSKIVKTPTFPYSSTQAEYVSICMIMINTLMFFHCTNYLGFNAFQKTHMVICDSLSAVYNCRSGAMNSQCETARALSLCLHYLESRVKYNWVNREYCSVADDLSKSNFLFYPRHPKFRDYRFINGEYLLEIPMHWPAINLFFSLHTNTQNYFCGERKPSYPSLKILIDRATRSRAGLLRNVEDVK